MPFEYKSLAQLQPAPAKTPEISNLVKNPSFDRCSLEPWKLTADTRANSGYIRFFLNDEVFTDVQNNPGYNPTTWASARFAYPTATGSRLIALWTGWNPFLSLSQTQVCPFPEDLSPALGSKTYYYAFSMVRYSSNSPTGYRLRVQEWDADYRFIKQNDLTFSPDYGWQSQASTKWHRVWGTFTTDPGTQYVSVCFMKDSADNIYHGVSNIYVGLERQYAEAAYNSLSQDLTYTYPFDKRRFGYIGEWGNSYTGKTFAGPLELLYTVPPSRSSIISSISITNNGKVSTPYRIAILPSDKNISQIELEDFISFDEISNPKENYTKAQGITLSAGDKIYVSADNGNVSFNLFGTEVY